MSSTALSGIALREITKRFPGVVANDRISLTIAPGRVHCLLGENGAGKSTLIGMLAGLQQPDAGRIEIDGAVRRITSPRISGELGIGVVHQHSTLIPAFTVLENLMLGERGVRLPRRQALARLAELSTLLGTPLDPHARASELGLGQQQQLEIAKAMWKGSRYLILDEPTSMLTPQAIDQLAQSIARLRAQGIGVVLVTHKLREAMRLGDCVTVLRGGRHVAHLSEEQLAQLSEAEIEQRVLAAMFGAAADQPAAETAVLAGAVEPVRVAAGPRRATAAAVLELRDVATRSRLGDVEIAEVMLALHGGEIFGVAGIDGHGQRALAEVIAGQRPCSSGAVRFDGGDVTAADVRARQRLGIRYVTDDRLHEGTVVSLSVALNLVLKRIGERPFWRLGRADSRAIRAEAEARIREYDIRTPSPATRAGTLSGGNIQKILLARELGEGARCLVVHKPTAGLDLKTVRLVRRALRDFAASGGSVLLISTDLDELVELADRIAVISHGRIVAEVENDGAGVAERVGQHMAGAIA